MENFIAECEFKSYPKISSIKKLWMKITQKINGTNAQIYIYDDKIIAGSRNRFLDIHDDNFGFANFVEENKDEIIEKLGPGRHYGEWAGPGINSGEGLKEKTLFLFDWNRWKYQLLPSRISTVPIIYTGNFCLHKIDEIMQDLKDNGSKIVPGFMKTEGIVISLADQLFKKVFEEEETEWTKPDIKKICPQLININHLLQPLRLKKLLSTDEKYVREYPDSLSEICKLYVADLEKENQIIGTEEEILSIKKSLSKNIFYFVKSHFNKDSE